ncbi:unnamed protein product [Calypogeia fissa]
MKERANQREKKSTRVIKPIEEKTRRERTGCAMLAVCFGAQGDDRRRKRKIGIDGRPEAVSRCMVVGKLCVGALPHVE